MIRHDSWSVRVTDLSFQEGNGRLVEPLGDGMPVGAPWSRDENAAAIDDYLDMLVKELRGERYSKAEHSRRLREAIPNRSRESVELKHPNISQALIDLGQPYIDGYKPRSHYQQSLRDVIAERLEARPMVAEILKLEATRAPTKGSAAKRDVFEPAPNRPLNAPRQTREVPTRRAPRALRVDWVAREASNSALGASGETFVCDVEHRRLWSSGNRRLAERIEQVSVTQGDGLGYDIHSFEADGRDRLIEVKTTRSGRCSPFFLSSSEIDASARLNGVYHLYRVFSFESNARIFVLSGALRAHDGLLLAPVVYRAAFA